METRIYQGTKAQWDEYVFHHPQGSFFHLYGWKEVVEKTFGHQSFYLMALENNQTVGVLPLFKIKPPWGAPWFVSVPYGIYGGVCADNELAQQALLSKAQELMVEHRAAYIELRHLQPNGFHLPQKDLYVTFIKELPLEPSQCLPNLPRMARKAVRKAIRDFGLESDMRSANLKEFYHLFALNKRRLASPSFPLALFKNILQIFPEQSDILWISYQGKAIAAVMSFFYRDTVMAYYSGGRDEYNPCRPNNFMYLKLMEYGVERGYRFFDFGRTRRDNPGPYQFKISQGFSPTPLSYQYCLPPGGQMPNLTPSNPKFRLAQDVWRRLPLWTTKVLSPLVVKYLP